MLLARSSQLAQLGTTSTGQRAVPQGFLHPIHHGWKDGEEALHLVKAHLSTAAQGTWDGGRGDRSPPGCPPSDRGRASWLRAFACRDQHSQRTEHPVLLDPVTANSG